MSLYVLVDEIPYEGCIVVRAAESRRLLEIAAARYQPLGDWRILDEGDMLESLGYHNERESPDPV
jgi:hypothetical protein